MFCSVSYYILFGYTSVSGGSMPRVQTCLDYHAGFVNAISPRGADRVLLPNARCIPTHLNPPAARTRARSPRRKRAVGGARRRPRRPKHCGLSLERNRDPLLPLVLGRRHQPLVLVKVILEIRRTRGPRASSQRSPLLLLLTRRPPDSSSPEKRAASATWRGQR